VEYQLNAIRKKYDLREDEQRVRYIHESAELICTLGSAVQREVYGNRVAEMGKISPEAMKMEVDKAYKRRISRDKKKQEQIDLTPARSLQPRSRTIRYDNMKSAMAEETVLAQILQEPSLMDAAGELKPEDFSVQMLGKVFAQFQNRYRDGLEVSLGVLADLSAEEMSHITEVITRRNGPVSEDAFRDCVRTIRGERQISSVSAEDDLLAFQAKLKESKGFKT
jgi:DNA primase